MTESESKGPTGRALLLGLFLILFGLVLGGMTFLTVVGPIFGLLLIGFGIFTIWKSAQGEPPDQLS